MPNIKIEDIKIIHKIDNNKDAKFPKSTETIAWEEKRDFSYFCMISVNT